MLIRRFAAFAVVMAACSSCAIQRTETAADEKPQPGWVGDTRTGATAPTLRWLPLSALKHNWGGSGV